MYFEYSKFIVSIIINYFKLNTFYFKNITVN